MFGNKYEKLLSIVEEKVDNINVMMASSDKSVRKHFCFRREAATLDSLPVKYEQKYKQQEDCYLYTLYRHK